MLLHIAKDSVPISTVEKQGISGKTRSTIPDAISVVAATCSLSNVSFFSATTDFWTSYNCQPYIYHVTRNFCVLLDQGLTVFL